MQFWINFIMLALNWSALVWIQGPTVYIGIVSSLFFSCYFILPIVSDRLHRVISVLLFLFSVGAFWSTAHLPYLWLILIVLCMETSLNDRGLPIVWYCLGAGSVLSAVLLLQNQWQALAGFIFLFSFTSYLLVSYKQTRDQSLAVEEKYKRISDRFAQMKRQMVTQEQVTRQEERSHIAREIHDSVGHRLTALLMQLEVARHQAEEPETKQHYAELKALAQDSLHDTRTAVKALRSDETAGIQAIIHLIRKLESESHLEIRFVIQSGVLGIKLSNEQSVTLYRSIQEALTNMMRHSKTRKATIEFVLLGERYLQFKVSHALQQKVTIKEGFGLTAMRDRLDELNGSLTLTQEQQELKVIGQFPLHKE